MAEVKQQVLGSSSPFVFKGADESSSAPFTLVMPRFETEYIDKDGDLTLEVDYSDEDGKPLKKRLVVCSKALSRSSPVFKKMLYGGFAESKKPETGGKPWIVELPEDDHDALKILLDMMHANFDQVPSDLSDIDDLHHITILTDKYDMAHLLRPWMRQWDWILYEDGPQWDAVKEKSRDCLLEKRLWIAWEVGLQARLSTLMRDLAYYSYVDTKGDLMSKDSAVKVLRFKDTLTPPGLYELIADTRLKMIEPILEFLEMSINTLILDGTGPLECRVFNPRVSKFCNATLLGSILKSLAEHRLWPIPDASDIKQSPFRLEKLLEELDVFGSRNHYGCVDDVKDALLQISRKSRLIEPQLSDTLKRHCETQAEKCGLSTRIDVEG